MNEDQDRPQEDILAANDNGTAETRLDTAVLTLARLLGRQIAREAFERLSAANDNRQAGDDREAR
ncbi:hypothetical protein HBA54_25895 [Pelagibius litoralis]|uniref:Uncharacterized protein n=1 Tax=Pelagibius litoralis TaxID=374515 RepID=A0A967F2X8_9PROT|nr:hypothetical protein [Pelagibius litoralis]NIA72038.1 hypothetical protein [Pelagibius litoralis]